MSEAAPPPRSPRIDWQQWCFPGPRRVFTPDELARAGNQPWPEGVDLYVYVNMIVLLMVNPVDLSRQRAGAWLLVGLVAAWAVLKVAKWLWVHPSRKRLNLAGYASGVLTGGIFGFVRASSTDDGRDLLRANAAVVVALLAVAMVGWWMLTLYRAEQIESRLRELDEQAERERLAARLGAAQIQPHFLFNTLASLQHWVETSDPRAAPLLRDFSTYLRATLPMFERELQPLSDELTMVRSYLAIMQARLGERLQTSIDIEPGLVVLLPPGSLLTLVENAIRHGIEPQLGGGRIEIRGRRVGQLAVLSVRDDGAGLSPAAQDGVGLSNTRRRLQQAFGRAASLQLGDADPGCLATMKLPL